MSTLSSLNTLEEVKAAFFDNAGYAIDGSPAAARIFIEACTHLMLRMPKRATHGVRGMGGNELEIDTTLLPALKAEAVAWLNANGGVDADGNGGGGYVHPDLSSFRS